jgi:hypothetical protein
MASIDNAEAIEQEWRKQSCPQHMTCGSCGMLVEPETAFHPGLYCRLFKMGILDPAGFLEGQHFIPDPAHWGEDAPAKQREAAR